MSQLVMIRGWLETEMDVVPAIINVTLQVRTRGHEFYLSDDAVELYQSGWIFPDRDINGTAFVFYGAHIRNVADDFLVCQIEAIAKLTDEMQGFFAFEYDDDDECFTLRIDDGQVYKLPPLSTIS